MSIRHRPGWQIKGLLKRRGLSQYEIAERVGCSQSIISRVIHRLHGVSPELTERVWQALEAALIDSRDDVA